MPQFFTPLTAAAPLNGQPVDLEFLLSGTKEGNSVLALLIVIIAIIIFGFYVLTMALSPASDDEHECPIEGDKEAGDDMGKMIELCKLVQELPDSEYKTKRGPKIRAAAVKK